MDAIPPPSTDGMTPVSVHVSGPVWIHGKPISTVEDRFCTSNGWLSRITATTTSTNNLNHNNDHHHNDDDDGKRMIREEAPSTAL